MQWSCSRCLSTMSWSFRGGAAVLLGGGGAAGAEEQAWLDGGPWMHGAEHRRGATRTQPCRCSTARRDTPSSWLTRSPNPRDHMVNVWGYSHLNFFAPMSRFAAGEECRLWDGGRERRRSTAGVERLGWVGWFGGEEGMRAPGTEWMLPRD